MSTRCRSSTYRISSEIEEDAAGSEGAGSTTDIRAIVVSVALQPGERAHGSGQLERLSMSLNRNSDKIEDLVRVSGRHLSTTVGRRDVDWADTETSTALVSSR